MKCFKYSRRESKGLFQAGNAKELSRSRIEAGKDMLNYFSTRKIGEESKGVQGADELF